MSICELCGEPLLPGEDMFRYHGLSGPCPKAPRDLKEIKIRFADPQTTIRKLREVANLKVGGATPEWFGGSNEWGPALSRLCGEAADLLERCLP